MPGGALGSRPRDGLGIRLLGRVWEQPGQRSLSHTAALDGSWAVLVKEAGLILVDPTLESLGLSGRGGPSDILL